MGDPAGVVEVLSSVIRPRDAYLLGTETLDEAVAGLYQLERRVTLHRMVVDRGTLRRPSTGGAVRLTARDIEDLNRLYQLGFRGGFPIGRAGGRHLLRRAGGGPAGERGGHARHQRARGDRRGGQRHDAASSTVATTSPRSRPAPSRRSCSTRVDDVALNVHTDNAPAVAAYQRLGFQAHCLLSERLARRRAGGWGIMRPIREALRLTWPRETR